MLVVDQNVHVAAHITAILELLDCHAIPIASVRECVTALNASQGNNNIDAVILSGEEVIKNGGYLISQIHKSDKK